LATLASLIVLVTAERTCSAVLFLKNRGRSLLLSEQGPTFSHDS
jgi:hypothetical protein